jgi:hypothetical protein
MAARIASVTFDCADALRVARAWPAADRPANRGMCRLPVPNAYAIGVVVHLAPFDVPRCVPWWDEEEAQCRNLSSDSTWLGRPDGS